MTFIWPFMLALLVLVPVGIILDRRIEQRRRARLAAFGQLAVQPTAAGRARGWRRRIPSVLMGLGITVMLVAVARPQSVLSLPRLEGTIILAFDVSGSMSATDFTPTRMDAAKAAAKAFVERQPTSVVVGVVAFSDSGLSVQVPTADQATIIAAIDRLTPQRGTSLGQGILSSVNAIALAQNGPASGYYTNRSPAPSLAPLPPNSLNGSVIVLLSDGENNERPDPIQAAQLAKDQGVRIETVGIGSPDGTTVDINGFKLHTQLNSDLLQQIASTTGGEYHQAATEPDLQKIYDNLNTHLVVKPEETEVTSIFAGAGVALLLLGSLLSLRWLGRVL